MTASCVWASDSVMSVSTYKLRPPPLSWYEVCAFTTLFLLLFSFMGCLIYLSYLCILNFALRQRGNKCWNKKLSNKQKKKRKKKRWTAIMLRICNGIEMLWGDLCSCCSLQLILSMCCHDGPGVKASECLCFVLAEDAFSSVRKEHRTHNWLSATLSPSPD